MTESSDVDGKKASGIVGAELTPQQTALILTQDETAKTWLASAGRWAVIRRRNSAIVGVVLGNVSWRAISAELRSSICRISRHQVDSVERCWRKLEAM